MRDTVHQRDLPVQQEQGEREQAEAAAQARIQVTDVRSRA